MPKKIKMRRSILFFSLLLCSTLSAQIEDNEYFEILQSVEGSLGNIQFTGDNYFTINDPEGRKKAFLMDTLGNRVNIPCNSYKRNSKMGSDLLYCYQDSLVGIFSIEKNDLITPLYGSIHSINKNFYAVQKEGLFHLYNSEHQLLKEVKSKRKLKSFFHACDENHVSFYQDNNEIVIHYSGKEVKGFKCFNNREAFSDGSYLFSLDGKLGVKSKAGQEIIPPQFEHINEWVPGKYIVSTRVLNDNTSSGIRAKHKDLKGIVDKEGQTLLPLEYDYINTYSFGLVTRKPDCKNVLLSSDLENIYDKEFESIRASESGFIQLKDENDLYYDLVYDARGWSLQNGIKYGKVVNSHVIELEKEDGRHVLINRKGEELFDTKGESIRFKKINNDLVEVKYKNSAGILKNDGTWLIEPGNYSFRSINRLEGFMLRERANNSNNLYSSKGKKLANGVQIASLTFPSNAYILRKGEKVGVIDDGGKTLIPFKYETIREFMDLPGFYKIQDGGYSYLVRVK